MHFVYHPSIDPGGLECQDLIDKHNGNATVASDVRLEYMPLLKAAPRLLEATKGLLAAFEHYEHFEGLTGSEWEAMEKAQDVIAEMEG